MDYIALDTDVASNLIKRQVPPTLLAKLARYAPCVTFVTLGELTEWAIVRAWGSRNIAVLDRWLATVPVIGYDEDVARRWGHLSAQTRRAGRPRPVNDMWNAACCLAENLPLATLNVKDYQDFAEHGLELVTSD
ncbi:MAG: type II toxin-antitoxin system VapC family toxin [Pseudonocardiaceae bacterium]